METIQWFRWNIENSKPGKAIKAKLTETKSPSAGASSATGDAKWSTEFFRPNLTEKFSLKESR
jgi:hypothetical protein